MGFTLRPGTELEAWGDSFTSNELGFRTHPPTKPPGTYRIVFVGDSWAYGMGVAEDQAYPAQLEVLANQHSGMEHAIEAWNLALPGWNTINEVTALEVFFDRISPDAVVLCPVRNDNSSELYILPDGSARRPTGIYRDLFGDDHSLDYRYMLVDSFRFMRRWQQAFAAIAATEAWLETRGVPLFLFFAEIWPPEQLHFLVADAGLRSPYAIAPPELLDPDPSSRPWRHGTPENYRGYARMVYRLVARSLGWQELTPEPGDPDQAFFDSPPQEDWSRRLAEAAVEEARAVPAEYRSRADVDPRQCAGPMDCARGLMGRATTVLLRRLEGVSELEVRVRPVLGSPSLYPLELRVTIPTAGDSSEVVHTIASADVPLQVFTMTIPESIGVGSVMEVELRASGAALAPNVLALRSLIVHRLRQIP